MKKNIYAYIIVSIFFGIIMIPCLGMAKLVAISDESMDAISGQAGIVQMILKDANLKMSSDTIYYGDDDGTDRNGKPAFLSLCNFGMDAEIHAKTPIEIAMKIVDNPFNPGNKIQALIMKINDLTMDVHNLNIGAIRVGSAIGEGKSFGSFGIQHLHAEFTGNMMIWAH